MVGIDRKNGRLRRKRRVRKRISGTQEKPRVSVFRSIRHFFVQAIDDVEGRTMASISTKSVKCQKECESHTLHVKVEDAKALGMQFSEVCKAKGIEKAVFDRNGYSYSGKVKAFVEGAREGGLKF